MGATRRGRIFFCNELAGTIEQKEDEFIFVYNKKYLENKQSQPISLTLPLQKEPFLSKTLFPFFDGLIPEGWLLDISAQAWKVNWKDRMGLLLTVCRDCIGAVSIEPEKDQDDRE